MFFKVSNEVAKKKCNCNILFVFIVNFEQISNIDLQSTLSSILSQFMKELW